MANWTIALCEHDVRTGGIIIAHWRASVEDGGCVASTYGTVSFTPDATVAGFKPYDQVTEADVLSWVWKQVDQSEVEAGLATDIAKQKTPPTAAGLPWAE